MNYRKQVRHTVGVALITMLLASCGSSTTPTSPLSTPTPIPIRLEADGSGEYATLEEAVQAAPSGGSIFLGAGTYTLEQPLDIDKPLRLVGADADRTEVVSEAEGYVVRYIGDGVFAAEDITFRHEGDAVADVVVVEMGEIALSNCSFVGAVSQDALNGDRSAGLLIQGETTGIVEGCTATENGDGIRVADSAEVTLKRNLCADNIVGITFSDNSGGIALDNHSSWNSYIGIEVSGSTQPTLEHNWCNSNMAGGIVFTSDAGGVARLNQCSENAGAGIMVLFQAEPTLERNTFTDNSWAGIYYSGSSGGVAFQNDCSGGDHGIEVGGQAQPTLDRNLCTDNALSGIYYWEEAGGIARQNVCWGNSDGISALGYSRPALEENICVESEEACIYIEQTADPDLVDNECRDCTADIVDDRQSQISDQSPHTGTVVGETAPADASLGDTWVRPTDGALMTFVPGGQFQMGSDSSEVDSALQQCREYHDECHPEFYSIQQPAHMVTLDSIWIDQYEVTNEQFRQCVSAGSCEPPDEALMPHHLYYSDSVYGDYPVVLVDWHQASNYCEWVGARLPTEAEWEYAARGPEQLTYPWGNEFDGECLNYADANCTFDFIEWADDAYNDGYPHIAPIGSYPDGASWCGALDMAGNVWEWTGDWFGDYPSEPQDNPQGPVFGEGRILRGGCWACDRSASRTANRNLRYPGDNSLDIGFRCVVSVPNSE